LLSVAAREMGSGVEASISVKPSYGLADDDIARMLKDGFAHAEGDMAARSLREARVDAERMLLATRAAMQADGHLLSAAEQSEIEVLLSATQNTAQTGDADAITASIEALAQGTEAFAAARMNQGIRQALAGRRLEDV
jgi:molecular chaperone HscA